MKTSPLKLRQAGRLLTNQNSGGRNAALTAQRAGALTAKSLPYKAVSGFGDRAGMQRSFAKAAARLPNRSGIQLHMPSKDKFHKHFLPRFTSDFATRDAHR